MSTEPSKGTSYWVTQIVAFTVFAIGGFAGAYFFFVVDTEEPGRGLILGLLGVAGVVGLIWVFRQLATTTKTQRAVYAWAIMQHQSPGLQRSVDEDRRTMALAARARDGKLSVAEWHALQALNPANPYPGSAPSPTAVQSQHPENPYPDAPLPPQR